MHKAEVCTFVLYPLTVHNASYHVFLTRLETGQLPGEKNRGGEAEAARLPVTNLHSGSRFDVVADRTLRPVDYRPTEY